MRRTEPFDVSADRTRGGGHGARTIKKQSPPRKRSNDG